MTTVEIIFNSTVPQVVAGDVKVTEFGSAALEALLRFEDTGDVADLFLYSIVGGGYSSAVGLPSTFQGNIATIADNSNYVSSLYDPSSSQPGFCTTCGTRVEYALTSVKVAEASSMAIVLGGLSFVFFTARRKKQNLLVH